MAVSGSRVGAARLSITSRCNRTSLRLAAHRGVRPLGGGAVGLSLGGVAKAQAIKNVNVANEPNVNVLNNAVAAYPST